MRTAFIEELCLLAGRDERIWLLGGDLGFSVLERFIERFPGRYINMGVAEQNMTGVAAGLALEGRIVFTYSIANFPVVRCLEQIRNDVCVHNLNVKIAAVGGGVAYGAAGYSHHAVEDLAVMRAMPNTAVLAPGDPVEARLAARAAVDREGPCYIRLGKGGEPVVHRTDPEFTVGKAIPVRAGNDLTIISTGGLLGEAAAAADQLAPRIRARVLSMPWVHPLDTEALHRAAAETGLIVVVEEHSAAGGLGGAAAEALTASPTVSCPLVMMNLGGGSLHAVGSQAHLRRECGLDAGGIVRTVREHLRNRTPSD
jgi:transketolase